MGTRLEANSSAIRKRIEKHTFENEEGEEYGASNFGGFGEYFRRKKIKLQNLDVELRSSGPEGPSIFRGVVAHVNGYTQPSLNDLHALIVKHGGGFMQYLDGKTAVTHIIASNLTPKKKVEFQKYRIVKPAWVVDSIKAGKLLPWNAYRVVDEGAGQNLLGFENGSLTSQANSQRAGYRDQTDRSWYTSQVQSVAKQIDERSFQKAPESQFSSNQSLPEEESGAENPLRNYAVKRFSELAEELTEDSQRVSVPDGRMDNEKGSKTVHDSHEELQEHSGESPPESAKIRDMLVTSHETKIPSQPNDTGHALPWADGKSFPSPQALSAEEHNALLLADPKVWKSTGVNPDFLKQYYEESRLHHLSTWKAELKSQLQALTREKSSSQKAIGSHGPGARRYILHVDFDSFFAAVSLKKHPQYVNDPVVIAHGGGSGSEIASCNYPAREFGIKNGMWMKNAQRLCPKLKVLPYDFKAYEAASRSFYEAIIDTGGIVQSVSVDEALVDVSTICIKAGGHSGIGIHEGSIWHEQEKAENIALGIREVIKETTGCAVSVGIGGNILLAKLALRKAKPAGQYHVKPDQALDFVGAITVQELPGVAHSIGGKLEEIGVKFVKDVRELTKERLMSTLGPKTGDKIWDYSRGIDRTEVGEQAIRKSVSAEVNWGIRFVTQEQADEFVESLCEELYKRLANEGVKGQQMTMKIMRRAPDAPLDPPKHLGHGKCDSFSKSVVLKVATCDKEVLAREAISILRGWGFSPGELRGIGVQMTKLVPLRRSANDQIASSQKRLHFRHLNTPPKAIVRSSTTEDDVESPPQPMAQHPHETTALANDTSPSGKRKSSVNTLGTQFVLPSQADSAVLFQLPEEIRSKLQKLTAKIEKKEEAGHLGESRMTLPALPPDASPAESQLDREMLDSLPEDVRGEVLAFYRGSPRKPYNQTLLPQSPHKNRSINIPKKASTPTKKRSGPLFRGKAGNKINATTISTLTQSNFVATHKASTKAIDEENANSAEEEPSDEFLSALPEDIRRELLDQQRRDRLKMRGGIDLAAKSSKKRLLPAEKQPPPGQRRIELALRPPKPTFTSRNLSTLPELRKAIRGWIGEFQDEAPFEEDVNALLIYLKKVVQDERNMTKAVAVVTWLKWLVDEKDEGSGKDGWNRAIDRVEGAVQDSVQERGLGHLVL
ncbi:MAG: hypothetical protein Q9214_002936 [Letrouitia sp. 1 TL-2023]